MMLANAVSIHTNTTDSPEWRVFPLIKKVKSCKFTSNESRIGTVDS